MRLAVQKFPHFPRLFSATAFYWSEKVLLWCMLILLFSLNSYALLTIRSHSSPLFFQVITHPLSANAHIQFANELWHKGLEENAKHELTLASEFSSEHTSNVLGASTDPVTFLSLWKEEPAQKETVYAFWQHVIEEKPDYRDAYLAAGSIAYELLKNQEAKIYLEKAHELDPNSAIISNLLLKLEAKQ